VFVCVCMYVCVCVCVPYACGSFTPGKPCPKFTLSCCAASLLITSNIVVSVEVKVVFKGFPGKSGMFIIFY